MVIRELQVKKSLLGGISSWYEEALKECRAPVACGQRLPVPPKTSSCDTRSFRFCVADLTELHSCDQIVVAANPSQQKNRNDEHPHQQGHISKTLGKNGCVEPTTVSGEQVPECLSAGVAAHTLYRVLIRCNAAAYFSNKIANFFRPNSCVNDHRPFVRANPPVKRQLSDERRGDDDYSNCGQWC